MANLTLVTGVPRGSFQADLIQVWAESISALSGGAHKIQVFHAGELVPQNEVYDAVAQGVVDLGWFASPLRPEFAGLTLGLENSLGADSATRLFEALGRTADRTFDLFGLDLLAAAYMDVNVLTGDFSGMALPQDLAGEKIAGVGLGLVTFLDSVGAVPVSLPDAELYQAIQAGIVDGTMMPLETTVSGRLDEVTQGQVVFPDAAGLGAQFSGLVVNQASLADMPTDLAALLQSTTGSGLSAELGTAALERYNENLAVLAAQSDSVSMASSETTAAWAAAFDAILAEVIDALPPEAVDVRDDFLTPPGEETAISGIADVQDDQWNGPGPFAIILPSNLGVNAFAELDGATVIVRTGTTVETALSEAFASVGNVYEPVPITSYAEAVQKFLAGAGDVLIVPAASVTLSNLQDGLSVLAEGFTAEGNVVVLDFTGAGTPPDPEPPVVNPDAGLAIDGTAGDDSLTGGNGPDTIVSGAGDDSILGGSGDDQLFAQDGNDTVDGGSGDDNIGMSSGNDVAFGGPGNDLMGGGTGDDVMDGGEGNDFMGGGQGNDTVDGRAGNDVVNGGPGDDSLIGGDGNDTMGGSFGADTLRGGAGNDDMGGGAGQDVIAAGAGNDSVGGGEANDVISGDAGNDFLAGGGRDDRIDGGTGDDSINGGDGDDTMSGGTGSDQFIFNTFNPADEDLILDFQDGLDAIRMTGIENAPGTGLQGRVDALNIEDSLIDGQSGVVMTYEGHVIRVIGVSAAALGVEDFVFV